MLKLRKTGERKLAKNSRKNFLGCCLAGVLEQIEIVHKNSVCTIKNNEEKIVGMMWPSHVIVVVRVLG